MRKACCGLRADRGSGTPVQPLLKKDLPFLGQQGRAVPKLQALSRQAFRVRRDLTTIYSVDLGLPHVQDLVHSNPKVGLSSTPSDRWSQ